MIIVIKIQENANKTISGWLPLTDKLREKSDCKKYKEIFKKKKVDMAIMFTVVTRMQVYTDDKSVLLICNVLCIPILS